MSIVFDWQVWNVLFGVSGWRLRCGPITSTRTILFHMTPLLMLRCYTMLCQKKRNKNHLFITYNSPSSQDSVMYCYYSDTGSLRTTWPNITPFVPLLSHPIRSLGHILTISSSIMSIVIKEEHLLDDVSVTMSSELRRHCTHISLYKESCFHDVFPQIPVQPSTECMHTDHIWFFDRKFQKTQSQTKFHPSIDRHSRRRQTLPLSVFTVK